MVVRCVPIAVADEPLTRRLPLHHGEKADRDGRVGPTGGARNERAPAPGSGGATANRGVRQAAGRRITWPG